jgi:hypothetical protein
MIFVDEVKISKLADYDQLTKAVDNPLYINNTLIEELKNRIGLKIKSILIEKPYRDLDFSSVYSSFYSKKHKTIPKDCYRLHFFEDDSLRQDVYMGFLVLRPSLIGDSRGRGIIDPKLLAPKDSHLMLCEDFTAHIYGDKYKIRAFPWMAQETDIAICAHSAAWSIVRYFSWKYSHHQDKTLNEIVELTPPYINRRTPSEGLNLLQISTILSDVGFHPLFLNVDAQKESFLDNIFIYIESGIPVIAAIKTVVNGKPFNHAVCLIGHGSVDYTKTLDFNGKQFCLSREFVDSIIAIDDNHLPYVEVSDSASNVKYTLNDIKSVVVPLYEKMFLPADVVLSRIKTLIESKTLNLPSNPIVRPYLTSTRSLKNKAQNNTSMNDQLKEVLLQTPMPRFVWCVDISTEDQYKNGLCCSRVIVDATAGTYDVDPFILSHDDTKCVYYDSSDECWRIHKTVIAPYELYRNNLKSL